MCFHFHFLVFSKKITSQVAKNSSQLLLMPTDSSFQHCYLAFQCRRKLLTLIFLSELVLSPTCFAVWNNLMKINTRNIGSNIIRARTCNCEIFYWFFETPSFPLIKKNYEIMKYILILIKLYKIRIKLI